MTGTSDTSSAKQDGRPKPNVATSGVSQFLAKVLDQLSITAWLPAVMFISTATLLLGLWRQGNLDLATAVNSVAETNAVGLLVAAIFGVIVLAVASQAFAFECIRALEGYWGRGKWVARLAANRVRSRQKAAEHARQQLSLARTRSFESACERLATEPGFCPLHVEHLRWLDSGMRRSERPAGSRRIRRESSNIAWRHYARTELLHTEDRWRARSEDFPATHRILPTRLGNVLRSYEDRLELGSGEDLEGVILRRYDEIAPHLKLGHDQWRDRLEMYCVLVALFTGLGILAVPALWGSTPAGWDEALDWVPSAAGVVVFGLLSYGSYTAAIASARAYGSLVVEIVNASSTALRANPARATERIFAVLRRAA